MTSGGIVRPNNSPPGGNNVAKAKINLLHADTRYRMVIRKLYLGNHNYIYVGVPGDSIFGTSSINCVQKASGRLTIDPDVSEYAEIGGNFKSVGGINNTQNTATALLEYNHRIWYGSNNDDYNAGDQGLQQTGWTAVNVGAGGNPDVHTYNLTEIGRAHV